MVKQFEAEFLFQILNLARESRLSYVQSLCNAAVSLWEKQTETPRARFDPDVKTEMFLEQLLQDCN